MNERSVYRCIVDKTRLLIPIIASRGTRNRYARDRNSNVEDG